MASLLLSVLESEGEEFAQGPVGSTAYFVSSEEAAYAEPQAIITGNMTQG